jgi:hypothetical protein
MRKASELSIETKLKIVKSYVEPFLLSVYETWEFANKITRDVQTFINIYVREIGNNSLPRVWRHAQQKLFAVQRKVLQWK